MAAIDPYFGRVCFTVVVVRVVMIVKKVSFAEGVGFMYSVLTLCHMNINFFLSLALR